MDVPNDPDVLPVAARVPPAAVENVDSPPAAASSRGEPRIGGVSLLPFILCVPGCNANDRDVAEGAVDRCLFQILGGIDDGKSFVHGVHWEKQQLCANDFLRDWSPELGLLACAACGYRHLATSSREFAKVFMDSGKLEPLRYSTEAEADFQKKSDFYKRLKSSFVYGDQRYHLHPELVNTSDPISAPHVFLCSTCNTALPKSVPRTAIAAGVDFGNPKRLNLPQLSLVEKCLLARFRVYAVVPTPRHLRRRRLHSPCFSSQGQDLCYLVAQGHITTSRRRSRRPH